MPYDYGATAPFSGSNPYRQADSANVLLHGGLIDDHHRQHDLFEAERGIDPNVRNRFTGQVSSAPIIHNTNDAFFDYDTHRRWCERDESYRPPLPSFSGALDEEMMDDSIISGTDANASSSPSTQITSPIDEVSTPATSDISKTSSSMVPCPHCSQVYTKSSIRKHINRVHVDKITYKHNCLYCEKRFFQSIELQNHISTHREQRSWRYLCPDPGCERHTKGHTKRDNTVRHIKKAHPEYCLNEKGSKYGPVLKEGVVIEKVPWENR